MLKVWRHGRLLITAGRRDSVEPMKEPPNSFLADEMALESVYLSSDDVAEQSGFHGGLRRWSEERRGVAEAIDRDGDFLDVGCANGLLAADVVRWCAERVVVVVPYGIDIGPGLVRLAAQRLADHADNFAVANAWAWKPNRQWDFVYSLLDLSPPDIYCEWVCRLSKLVAPRGRLILGAYGSRSRGVAPERPADVLRSCGFEVTGTATSANANSEFAWTDVGAKRP